MRGEGGRQRELLSMATSSVEEERRQPGNEVTTAVVSFPGSSTRME